MDITIRISTVHAIVLLLAVVALGTVSFAAAYGTTTPSTFGHTVGEIDTSGTFSQLKTSKLCIGSVCETAWPDAKPKVTDYSWDTGPAPTIGTHDVCFLSYVGEASEDGSACYVVKSGSKWVINGYNVARCDARCLDW